MVSFGDGLADGLEDRLKLPSRTRDASFDELQLRTDKLPQFLHSSLVFGNIANGLSNFRMFSDEIIFAGDRLEDDGEVLCKPSPSHE